MANKSVRFACPNCKKRLKAARPEQAGKTTRCPFCGCRITIPLPADSPQDPAGAGHESTIHIAQYEGREADHLPSQPAKNPFVYAVAGAGVVLLVGGGLLAAYLAGQSKSTAVAGSAQPPAGSLVDQSQGDRTSPQRPSPAHQPVASSQLPAATTATSVAGSLAGTSGKQGASSPSTAPVGKGSEPESSTRGPQPGNRVEQPESSPQDRLPVNDANRPRQDPIDLIQPVGAEGVDTTRVVVPRVVEIPVLIPANYHAAGSSSQPAAIPDLSVVIRPEDAFAAVMKVDHLSNPGISTKLVVTLDKTPKTEVQVTVSADNGLVVDPTSLTFAANVAPIQQVLAISGNGNADMPLGPSKVLYVHVAASGGGLTANSPAQIPVQVLRRNSFLMTNGLAVVRSDVTSPGSTTSVLSNWQFSVSGNSPILTGEQYTAEYVQLKGNRARFRFYEDRIELEQPTGSGNYQARVTGSWQ